METEAETEGGQTEEKLKGKERWMEELKRDKKEQLRGHVRGGSWRDTTPRRNLIGHYERSPAKCSSQSRGLAVVKLLVSLFCAPLKNARRSVPPKAIVTFLYQHGKQARPFPAPLSTEGNKDIYSGFFLFQ